MHCVYFARHGETVWNVENKICGMTDSPLTEKGRAQAAQLGEAVKNSGIVLDEILYSPLSRAADTALAVAAATGLQLAQRIYNLLDELKQDDKTYLLVAHNGIARVVESYFHNMTNAEYAAFGIKNCELRKFDFDE